MRHFSFAQISRQHFAESAREQRARLGRQACVGVCVCSGYSLHTNTYTYTKCPSWNQSVAWLQANFRFVSAPKGSLPQLGCAFLFLPLSFSLILPSCCSFPLQMLTAVSFNYHSSCASYRCLPRKINHGEACARRRP